MGGGFERKLLFILQVQSIDQVVLQANRGKKETEKRFSDEFSFCFDGERRRRNGDEAQQQRTAWRGLNGTL